MKRSCKIACIFYLTLGERNYKMLRVRCYLHPEIDIFSLVSLKMIVRFTIEHVILTRCDYIFDK